MRRLDIAGRDITWVLKQQLQKNGIQLSLDIADIVKHKVCYVAHDDAYELARPLNDVTTQYVLPDKNVINVGYERFKAPEVIFQPKQLEMNDAVSGISEFVHQAIKTSDVALRGKLAENIVLVGRISFEYRIMMLILIN